MAQADSRDKTGRVTSYPFVPLDTAIKRAETLYSHVKRNPFTVEVAAEHWGYKPTTSNVRLCLAAMRKFDLLDTVSGGKSGMVRLSRLALDIILLDEKEHAAERLKAIQEVALRPKMYSAMWDLWGPDLPSEATMRATLIRQWDFDDSHVGGFIKNYKRTIIFARLDRIDSVAKGGVGRRIGGDEDEDDAPPRRAEAPMTAAPAPHANSVQAAPALPGPGPANMVDLSYPLFGDDFAILRVTKPMSQESFELLQEYIGLLGKSLGLKPNDGKAK